MPRSNSITIKNVQFAVKGNLIRTATVKEEWDEDICDPSAVILGIKKSDIRIDLFSFAQRLPESKPKYNYKMEWDSVAAIQITTYDNWFKNQIPDQARNKIKKAKKLGVEVKEIEFGDKLIKAISNIYNETDIRQGRKNKHYKMPYEIVKKLNATFLDRSKFFAAYYRDEIIGYIKIVYTDRFARVMGILGKNKYKDKSPMNLLVSKAVEVCASNNIPFFVYGKYDYGSLGSDSLKEFKKNNGFENFIIPRYFMPLNFFGKMAIKARLHMGFKNIIPEKIAKILLKIRKFWNGKVRLIVKRSKKYYAY
jgi:hypothetical protein